ncbi:bifunctional enoyl-CoA hydratase/phosphate acetyltransferase [Alteribacter keqinensis]|uniref:Bifunctional enoyl-CoA hydratase/phosphate acetyltransferase n=1 Tax=Alteribacter keqinensis TaxID=2483800 RepID=A0A3M7TUU6_9BACI|nr:bifunctional enoyl-CoA hydratase/phosphate acetyltransferase [Alteribacter keqinensis]
MKGGFTLTFEDLLKEIQSSVRSERKVAVAHATDEGLFFAAKQALEYGIASFIFVGPLELMKDLSKQTGVSAIERCEFIDSETEQESAMIAAGLVGKGDADVLMKGMVGTSTLLKAVLNKESGLRTGNVLSHVAAFDLPARTGLLFVTDAAMNIAPDLKEKIAITQNAVDVAKSIGIKTPKVAALAAVETVNPAMQATLDAAVLTQMNKRGQIAGCTIDGPLAFDIAVSPEAARQKKVHSDVAGYADILVVPAIETGNALYKSLTIFGNAEVGGIITGAKAPIVLTSRADSTESKLLSIAVAVGSAG